MLGGPAHGGRGDRRRPSSKSSQCSEGEVGVEPDWRVALLRAALLRPRAGSAGPTPGLSAQLQYRFTVAPHAKGVGDLRAGLPGDAASPLSLRSSLCSHAKSRIQLTATRRVELKTNNEEN